MKESIYRSYDELPLFLNAATVAKVLGVSPSIGYELMHEQGFPFLRIGNINQMLSSALNSATEQRLIPSNPTKGCVLPKLEKKEMKILPPESLGTFFSIAIGADTIGVQKSMNHSSEYVFPSPNGGPMSPDSILHMLQRVLKRAGLERIRFHDLRNIFSVLALQNGVDVKTLSSMLGHYSAGFTLDTYAYVTTSSAKAAAVSSVPGYFTP